MKRKFTVISIWHYVRLVYRSALFLILLVTYIQYRLHSGETITERLDRTPAILYITWAVFTVEMIFRFFPSRFESPGCQKQFARNALRMADILDDGIMILLCSAYSICDLICILFFCPFQTWFMKNKCCSVCRIYNWDYAMMFTPLFFVRRDYSWSLLALSIALLVRWEITIFRHPERFSEKTNDYLQCRNCTEKLCVHKKQLKTLWKQIEEYTSERIRRLKE